MHTPPRSLLVATDLSSRCDRAVDRAALLARQWNARLVVLTVLEQGGALAQEEAAALREQARRRLLTDLGDADLLVDVHVGQGPVAEQVLALAAEQRCDLIVTGTARAHGLGRLVLGSTVDALVRRAPVPLLVVRQRGQRHYPGVLVASDWSEPSRLALQCALALWPDTPATLFHAYGAAYPARVGIDLAHAREAGGEQATRAAAAFVAAAVPAGGVPRRLGQWLEAGDPGLLLQSHGYRHPDDLVALGTEGRSGLAGLLLGSVAARILDMVDNDVLLVRPPKRDA